MDYFSPFYPPNNPNNQKFLKIKKFPADISFYTCIPKIMITRSVVPEIWCATEGRTDGGTEKMICRKGVPHLISVHTFIQLLQTTGNNFSDFISNNINTFMELLPNNTTHFPRNQTILTLSESPFQIKLQKKIFFRVHITQ